MNSRQRVIAAINHQAHDRIPLDIGALFATGLTVGAYDRLRRRLALGTERIRVVDPIQMLAEVGLPLLQAFDVDVIGLFCAGGHLHGWQDWTTPDGTDVSMPRDLQLTPRPDGGWQQCRQSVLTAVMPQQGLYFDPVEHPPWPSIDLDFITDELLQDVATRSRRCRQQTDLAVLLNSPWGISNCSNPDFLCSFGCSQGFCCIIAAGAGNYCPSIAYR